MSSDLFGDILRRGPVHEAVGDRAWLQALLDAEASLAAAHASQGVIGESDAAAIAAACVADRFDAAELAREAARHGNPVLPIVDRLRAMVPHEVAGSVHKGATSQDIMDTATMAVASGALDVLLADAAAVCEAAARLTREHRALPMAGRTLMQRAEPVTFGYVALMWMIGLDEAREWMLRVRRRTRISRQSGGAVGLVSAYPEMVSWHVNRVRVAELASSLGAMSGVVAKIAGDVVLLAQTEVGEVAEARPGGSSAMPHKRNPIAAISAKACAAQAPGLVATLMATMAHEHQRAAGMWHAEWRPLRELLVSTGSAVSWLRESLEGLRVDPSAMAANLGGADTAGAVAAATVLVDRILEGRQT